MHADAQPLLRLTGINTSYGPIRILQDVEIQVTEGEIVCLLGGNASGKSTTLKTILGIVKPRRAGAGKDHLVPGGARHGGGAREPAHF
jgi:ABC-type branched-subunit amino acid transport system ATPase component